MVSVLGKRVSVTHAMSLFAGLRWLLGFAALALARQDRPFVEPDSESDYGNYQGDLIYLQILGSNGFYAPLELYPGDPNRASAWPGGMGKITSLGMLQQFQLGKALRKRYKEIITSDPREVEVFSSCEDRAVQSCLSLLASLYAPSREWRFAPNFRWQPIPVTWAEPRYDKINGHHAPYISGEATDVGRVVAELQSAFAELQSVGVFLGNHSSRHKATPVTHCLCPTQVRITYVGYSAVCPKLMIEYRKIIKSAPAKAFIKSDEFLYSYWRNQTGWNIEKWNDVAWLFDILYREDVMGLEIPSWARDYWSDLQRITNAAYKWNFNSRLSLKAKIGSLIDLMVDRMRAKTLEDDPSPETKINIYMTHDWNIAAFLGSMFRYNGLRPPPSATITMELYRYFDTHTVRMLFFNSSTPELDGANDQPVPLLIRGCGEYCPLAYVTNYFKDLIPKNWPKLCGLKTKAEAKADRDESGRPFSLSQP